MNKRTLFLISILYTILTWWAPLPGASYVSVRQKETARTAIVGTREQVVDTLRKLDLDSPEHDSYIENIAGATLYQSDNTNDSRCDTFAEIMGIRLLIKGKRSQQYDSENPQREAAGLEQQRLHGALEYFMKIEQNACLVWLDRLPSKIQQPGSITNLIDFDYGRLLELYPTVEAAIKAVNERWKLGTRMQDEGSLDYPERGPLVFQDSVGYCIYKYQNQQDPKKAAQSTLRSSNDNAGEYAFLYEFITLGLKQYSPQPPFTPSKKKEEQVEIPGIGTFSSAFLLSLIPFPPKQYPNYSGQWEIFAYTSAHPFSNPFHVGNQDLLFYMRMMGLTLSYSECNCRLCTDAVKAHHTTTTLNDLFFPQAVSNMCAQKILDYSPAMFTKKDVEEYEKRTDLTSLLTIRAKRLKEEYTAHPFLPSIKGPAQTPQSIRVATKSPRQILYRKMLYAGIGCAAGIYLLARFKRHTPSSVDHRPL